METVSRLVIGPAETDRISQMLSAEIQEKPEDGMIDPIFKVEPLGGNNVTIVRDGKTIEISELHQILSPEKRKDRSKRACQILFQASQATDMFPSLDEALSKALKCSWGRWELDQDPDETLQRACHILERLPSHPPPMMVAGDFDPYRDLSISHLVTVNAKNTWTNLKVSTSLDRNIIRMAIYTAIRRAEQSTKIHEGDLTLEYVNMLAELFEAADTLSSVELCPVKKQHWFLIKAFLWTNWHRSILIHLSGRLAAFLRYGTTYFETQDNLEFKGASTFLKHAPDQATPRSMCRWAFELVRTDRVATVLDLRLLCQRYAAFSETSMTQPRCLLSNDKATQCDGSSPYACKRFIQMHVEDQSAHALFCPGTCPRVHWNEASFGSVTGPKAISALEDVENGLKYCQASDETMTISHVWSHGQGGRPEIDESGLNYCLHHRYCLLALKNGCDSYWIDTACIPKNHELRREAIGHINDIFRDSKLTLVCDKDVMAVDIADLTIETIETLLSVLLVSDWNVRAWTLLEAMRGKSNIRLLCKDDRTISLRALIEIANREGSAEIATIFVTAKHLLPTRRVREIKPRKEYTKQEWRRIQGFLDPEEAACMLGRRHASRGGDELTIWALLCGDTAQKTAEEFWLAQENASDPHTGLPVHTGFLVSSAPRIASRHGFGWAPCRPSIPYDTMNDISEAFNVYDGRDTEVGYYSAQGLYAQWLISEFSGLGWTVNPKLREWVSMLSGGTPSQLDEIVLQWSRQFRRVAILRPVPNGHFWSTWLMTDVARLITLTGDGSRRHAVVIVGSDDGDCWKWLKVQGLPDQALNSLEFVKQYITIV